MIAFNDKKNQTHELSLTVHDSGPGWNVWLATVGDDIRYFEADDGVEVWDLIDMAAHCYDEEPAQNDAGWKSDFEGSLGSIQYSFLARTVSNALKQNEAAKRAEMFKEYTRAGQELPQTIQGADLKRLSEMNAPKIEYPALYRKLLSPEEFTD